ncbi:PAS fold [Globodera pallida]|nr:PAS fold [Globodera pallida]
MTECESLVSVKGSSSSGNEGRERFARENHSEIERRRRNKMTHYINELADMVPQCAALGRKPDKLTILRMAVSHMKLTRGNVGAQNNPPGTMPCQPSFLTDQELKHLILEAANGFLFVVACETARIIYVSDSILPVLNVSQEEWLNSLFYDLLHPEDVDKVRDQLCGTDSSHNRVLDMKTGTVKKDHSSARVHLNCRRGFICRMRIGSIGSLPRLRNCHPIFEFGGRSFVAVHCTGYLKSNAPLVNGVSQSDAGACLVAIARLQLPSMLNSPESGHAVHSNKITFRLTRDGIVTFADQKVLELMHKSSAELLGKHIWEYAHLMDEQKIRNAIGTAIQSHQLQTISCKWCQYNPKKVKHLPVSFDACAFTNPHSGKLEFVIATIVVEQEEENKLVGQHNENYFQHQLTTIGNGQATNFEQEPLFEPHQQNIVNMNWPDAISLPGIGGVSSTSLNCSNLPMDPSNVYLPNSMLTSASDDQRRWIPQFGNTETAVGLDMAVNVVWPEQQQQNFMQ